MLRPKTYRLEKLTSNGLMYWTITVHGLVTRVKASSEGGRPKGYPDMDHESPQAAFRFTQKEIQKKRNLGYKNQKTRRLPESQASSYSSDYDAPRSKRQYHNQDHRAPVSKRLWNKHKDTSRYGESSHFSDHDTDSTCSMGAAEDDTDSVASSYTAPGNTWGIPGNTAGFPGNTPGNTSGISPLNRHRLNRKPGEVTMEATVAPPPALLTRVSTTYFLRSQMASTNLERSDTVAMQSPGVSTLQKMDTMGKWESWREEPSATGPAKKAKAEGTNTRPADPYARLLATGPQQQPNLMPIQPVLKRTSTRTNPSPSQPVLKRTSTRTNPAPSQPVLKRTLTRTSPSQDVTEPRPRLVQKKSTTTSLRLKLANQELAEAAPRPADEREGGLFSHSPSLKGRLKRTATTLLSPITESPSLQGRLKRTATTLLSPITESPTGSMLKKSAIKRGASKKVLVLSPEESETRRTSSPKRPSTGDTKGGSGHRSKRLCVSSPRAAGSVRQDGILYTPNKSEWPINLVSPVLWYVPLVDSRGESLNGHTVFVDNARCLIALDDGTVVELDSSVKVVKGYKLPSGAKCLLPDGDFLYAGCQDGGLYDLTHREPRLVSHIKGFGQLLCLDVFEGLVAISDQHGNVALVNHSGDILWRHKSKGEFGWMVKIDATGIYHGHSRGVTKYSLDNGRQEWHLDTGEAVYDGVKTDSSLYLAVGHTVIKVDGLTGALLKTFDKGKSKTTTVRSLAVGAGLVFAGGKSIVCYDADSGQVVYVFTHEFKPTHMQYFQGRLFTVGSSKMAVLDITEATITTAKSGDPIVSREVPLQPGTPKAVPLKKLPTITSRDCRSIGGVLLQCVKPKARTGKLMVKALSNVKNQNWAIQLSPDLQKPGAKYMVDELRPCPAGNFYRVYGEISEVE